MGGPESTGDGAGSSGMSPGRGREMKGLGNTLQLQTNVHSTAPKEVRFSSVGHGARRGAPDNGRAHKLALSQHRKQQIQEQLQANSLSLPESNKQTYNPYHLSSYQVVHETATEGYGDQSPGVKGGNAGSSTIPGGSPLRGSPGRGDKTWGAAGDDGRTGAHQKGPGFSAEIRK